MPEESARTTLDSAISGDRANNFARELKNHDSRMAIKEVVSEYIASSFFAERVKTILLESLESTMTYKKIEDKVQNHIDKTLSARGLRQRNFLVPAIISAAGLLVAAVAAVIAFFALKQG